jgi:hypothetical protein
VGAHESNHPLRPFLKNWLWEHGRIGTRYLSCADGAIGYDEGRKAQFASEPHVYVHLGRDAADASRTGPAVHESGLARFLKAAQLGRPDDAGPPADVQRAAHDCIELGLFCAYQADLRQACARYALEPMFDDEIRDAAAADVRAAYQPLREQLAMYDYTVFHGLPAPLLLCDVPFVDWRVRARPPMPFVSMPLGPYALLVGTPSAKTARAGPVTWRSAVSMGPFKDQNRHLVDGARAWIVATSDAELAALQPRFAPPEAAPEGAAAPR